MELEVNWIGLGWNRRSAYGVGEKVRAPGGRPKPDIGDYRFSVLEEGFEVPIRVIEWRDSMFQWRDSRS